MITSIDVIRMKSIAIYFMQSSNKLNKFWIENRQFIVFKIVSAFQKAWNNLIILVRTARVQKRFVTNGEFFHFKIFSNECKII